ncbi:MAG: diguanylate cyclase [Alphaproteobacteria bacterium]|nr:MAG: diguanylate cyclase [Alphaproteobacteria bacterium]
MSLNSRIILWFIAALAVLAADAAYVYTNFRGFDARQDGADRMHQIITELAFVRGQLHDVQSSTYLYVISGENEDLAAFETAVTGLQPRFTALEGLVSDNAAQAARLKLVESQAERQITTSKQIIAAFKKDGPKAAASLVRDGLSAKEMETVRRTTYEMSAEETRLLGLQQSAADEDARRTLLAGAAGLGLCCVMLAFVFLAIGVENKKRRASEESLKRALAETKGHAEEEAVISGMTNFLQSCRSTEEAHAIIGKTVHKLLPGTSGAIYLFNNSRNLVEIQSHWGDITKVETEFMPEHCWALRSGRIHATQPGGIEPCCTHFRSEPKGGTVCLPMQAHGDTLGMFLLVAQDKMSISEDEQRIVRNVSEQASLAISNLKLQHRLLNQSIRDPLTGLFNRRYLEETMEREFSRAERNGQPVSLLVLDIDHFKKFNDTQGHDAGDAVLVHFAQVLAKAARKEDVAARYGGEEFVLLLPNASAEMAEKRGNEICAATHAMKVSLGKGQIGAVTVSIGVATYPYSGAKPDDIITKADEALYEAKHNGRNQVRVSPDALAGKAPARTARG